MKVTESVLLFLISAFTLRAAQSEPVVVVTLEWLNHAEKACKGCSSQVIRIEAGSGGVFGEECGSQVVYFKILPRLKGELIDVLLSPQTRKADGGFIEGSVTETIVSKGEAKEVTIDGFRFRVSAEIAPVRK